MILAFCLVGCNQGYCESSPPRACKPTLKGFKIIIDQSQNQIFSPYNPTFEGYSHWTKQIIGLGGHVILNSNPLKKLLSSVKAPSTILVFGISAKHPKNPPSKELINFVANGGGLLVLTEHDNLFGITTYLNKVSSYFGIKGLPTGVFTKRKDTGNVVWIKTQLPAWNTNDIRLYYVAPLHVTPPATPLLRSKYSQNKKHNVLAAYRRYKKGVVVVIGDAEFPWNGNSQMGLYHRDNKAFTQNLLMMLAHKHSTQKKCTQTKIKQQPTSRPINRKMAAFLNPETGLSPTYEFKEFATALQKQGYTTFSPSSPSALQHAKVVVIPQPISSPSKEWLKAIKKHPKVLLLSDGMSDLFRTKPKIRQLFKRLLKKPVIQPIPINQIAQQFGLRFHVGTLLSNNKLSYLISAKTKAGKELKLYRSTGLDFTNTNKWKIIAKTTKTSWMVSTLMPIHHADKKDENPFSPPSKKRPLYPIAAFKKNIFAIADIEPFTNTYFTTSTGRYFYKFFLQWLQNKTSTSPTSSPTNTRSAP
tara:strand:+ start:3311 stop:4897 length:1587 start_codon:yes stop_codon:yes gene_type:complete